MFLFFGGTWLGDASCWVETADVGHVRPCVVFLGIVGEVRARRKSSFITSDSKGGGDERERLTFDAIHQTLRVC